ncbi:hypothetical protein [Rhodococcus wratislaviensis]|uniref:Uncharacterized protein n=1 Tax=Rhodococcus wratislaviensis NBRC 100605 TaxID=1219028 RepID=X0Q8J3_RHOWR|nr:hypothetical protein [Rhodococcus wratislaviensis]GAF47191.1 hypothetical protein RW1_038_01130 [Rhodococcus wratislaviensis NBRC 100605]
MTDTTSHATADDDSKPKRRNPRKVIDLDGMNGPNLTGPAFDKLFDPELTSGIIDHMGISKAFTTGLTAHTDSISKLAGLNSNAFTGPDSSLGKMFASPDFQQNILELSGYNKNQELFTSINEQVLGSFHTPIFKDWATSAAAAELAPRFGALAATMNVGVTSEAMLKLTDAFNASRAPSGLADRLVIDMPNLFPSIAPLQDWMNTNGAAMAAMTSPLLDFARQSTPHFRDVVEDHIELDVDDTTVVLPELTELVEGYESGEFDEPTFEEFAEAIERNPLWRAAIDKAVAGTQTLRAAVDRNRSPIRTVIKYGIFIALTTVITLATLASGGSVIPTLILSAFGVAGVMPAINEYVDNKLPDTAQGEEANPEE